MKRKGRGARIGAGVCTKAEQSENWSLATDSKMAWGDELIPEHVSWRDNFCFFYQSLERGGLGKGRSRWRWVFARMRDARVTWAVLCACNLLGPIQASQCGLARKHIADGPTSAASRLPARRAIHLGEARARQRSALHLEEMGCVQRATRDGCATTSPAGRLENATEGRWCN